MQASGGIGLVPEVPGPGKDHRDAVFVRRPDHVRILDRTSWLDCRRGPGFGCRDQAIGERKECIAANCATPERQPGLLGLPDRDAGGIDPRHLPGSDPERAILPGIDDRIRFDVLDDLPAKFHRLDLIARRRPRGHDLVLEIRDVRGVGVLDEKPAKHAAYVPAVLAHRLQDPHQAQVLLFLEERPRVGLEIRRDDHLAEDLRDRLRQRERDREVADDDAAKRRLLVGRKRLLPRLAQVGIGADPARVRVLEDRNRRLGKFRDQVRGGADIEDVVIRELLAVELFKIRVEVPVELGLLVRVFAVAQAHLERVVDPEARARLLLAVQEVGNRGIVGGRRRKRLDREALAQLPARPAVLLAHVVEDRRVVARIGHHADGLIVF